jgi:sigma-E factor negative regulatory protein RseA
MNDAIKMQISAFVDGELPQNEAELLLRRLCQDKELREQVAEYLAMGRAIRGERSYAGVATLRDRIAAALDDKSLQEEFADTESAAPRFLRPVAGVAIAATVALAVLLGLQQLNSVTEVESGVSSETIAATVDDSYTVPDQENNQLLDLYLSHSASSSHIGVDSINARLVTYEPRDSVNVATEPGEQVVDEDESEEGAELVDSTEEQKP